MNPLDLLAPLDYPRQAVANLGRGLSRAWSGEATGDDYLGMLPGALGAAAGLSGLGPLGMALMAGAGQGAGRAAAAVTGTNAFDAPTTQDIVGGMGGDPDSFLQNMGVQLATDPLTYAGPMAAAGAGGPLFRGKIPASRIPGLGAYLPEAPRPTGYDWTELAHARLSDPKPVLPLSPEAALAQETAASLGAESKRARDAMLAQPMPGPTGQPSPFNTMGPVGVYGDMIEDGAPFAERLGVARDIPSFLQKNFGHGDLPESMLPTLGRATDELETGYLLGPTGSDGSRGMGVMHGSADAPPIMDIPFYSSMESHTLANGIGRRLPHDFQTSGPSMAHRAWDMLGGGMMPLPPQEVNPLLEELMQQAGMRVNPESAIAAYEGGVRGHLQRHIPEYMLGRLPMEGFAGAAGDMYAYQQAEEALQTLLGKQYPGAADFLTEQARRVPLPLRGAVTHDDMRMHASPLIQELLQQIMQSGGLR